MLISELAQRTGVSVHALRHYEKLGLITPARRPSGYRDYPEALHREVVFIAMSRAIGFSLREVAQWLPSYRAGRLRYSQLIEAMQARVDAIDREIAGLKAQRKAAVDHIAWARARQKHPQAAPAARPAARPWPRTPATPRSTPRKERS